ASPSTSTRLRSASERCSRTASSAWMQSPPPRWDGEMKLADQLAFMRSEVQRSKKWRSNNYDDLWKRMIDLYRGKHWDQLKTASVSDRLVVNLAFATKNVIAPAVAIRNPRFVVN